jgi:hypothetical protein
MKKLSENFQRRWFDMHEFAKCSDAGLEGHDEFLLLDLIGLVEVKHFKDKLEFDRKLLAAEDDLV